MLVYTKTVDSVEGVLWLASQTPIEYPLLSTSEQLGKA